MTCPTSNLTTGCEDSNLKTSNHATAYEMGATMTYRFYQDLAKAHIAELEQEAQDARLARLRGAHVRSTPSNLKRLALHLFARLRQHSDSHGFGLRALTELSLASPPGEFDLVGDRSHPAREVLDGANHVAGRSKNPNLQMRLGEDEFSSSTLCVAMQSCCENAS